MESKLENESLSFIKVTCCSWMVSSNFVHLCGAGLQCWSVFLQGWQMVKIVIPLSLGAGQGRISNVPLCVTYTLCDYIAVCSFAGLCSLNQNQLQQHRHAPCCCKLSAQARRKILNCNSLRNTGSLSYWLSVSDPENMIFVWHIFNMKFEAGTRSLNCSPWSTLTAALLCSVSFLTSCPIFLLSLVINMNMWVSLSVDEVGGESLCLCTVSTGNHTNNRY